MLAPDPASAILVALKEAGLQLNTTDFAEFINLFLTAGEELSGPLFGRTGYLLKGVVRAMRGVIGKSFDPFTNFTKAREQFREYKKQLRSSVGDGPPMIICIDELDRCRPEYAVGMLEVLHHYFDCEGFLFVLGVNVRELSKSVSAVYGSDFDSHTYIRRLIGHRVPLLAGDRHKFLYSSLDRCSSDHTVTTDTIDRYSRALLDRFVVESPQISLRDIEDGVYYMVRALRGGDSTISVGTYRVPQTTIAVTMAVVRMVSVDLYMDMNAARLSDLEALRALNRICNRAEDWWMDSTESNDLLVCSVMEAVLIGWYRYASGYWTAETPLLRCRRLKADMTDGNYPSMVMAEADSLGYTFGYDFADARSLIERGST